MKKLLILFPLFACTNFVFAQEDMKAKDQRPEPKAMDPLMRAIDRNGDGSLQQVEIDMAVVTLRGLDRDKDGTVSASELAASSAGDQPNRPDRRPTGDDRPERPMQPGQDGQRGMPDFSRLDADGDGKISKEEAPERMKENFAMVDENGDGFLDKAEQEKAIKRLRERFQQQGQGQRPGFRMDQGDTSGGEPPKRPQPIE